MVAVAVPFPDGSLRLMRYHLQLAGEKVQMLQARCLEAALRGLATPQVY
jgi:hypothetical protein